MNQAHTPFCGLDCNSCPPEAPRPLLPDMGPPDDGEGPLLPEYTEYDPEAYDEMVRHDIAMAMACLP